jgi:hypothetical protein
MDATQNRWLALIYAATIFTSAFLLFQIQPLVSKAILPWFGGTPAVWTTCLLFFQSLLFAGYAYAHFSNTWLGRRQQAILHFALLFTALILLSALMGVLPAASWQPRAGGDPTWQILVMLALTIGLPYFVLAATGPLLQAWFAHSFPGRTPYRLYALSNVGSLLALLSYPFVLERMFDLPQQDTLWSAGFIAFGLLCGYAAWRVFSSARVAGVEPQASPQSLNTSDRASGGSAKPRPQPPSDTPNAAQPPTARPQPLHYLLWLLLPAFASVVLMATTNHVSTDVAVVPMLWVVPLSLYLLTFIIAFDRPAWYRPLLIAIPTLLAIYVAAFCSYALLKPDGVSLYKCGISGAGIRTIAEFLGVVTTDENNALIGPRIRADFLWALVANFIAMFGVCFLCHGELARLKPPARQLTSYYLMIALGGALGGLAVSIVAPHVFKTVFEWKLTIYASAILSIGLILYELVSRAIAAEEEQDQSVTSVLIPRVAIVVLLLPAALVLLDMVEYLHRTHEGVVFRERNFFGTLAIRDENANDPQAAVRLLLNGTTIHGSQFLAPERRPQPTSYYATFSGIGRVLNFFHGHRPPGGVRIGDVGLGAGTLAAYAMKGDFLTFYEINPAVIEMANSGEWFTYIADCRARGAKVDIQLGDARLALEREVKLPNLPRYHVLVLDAFSGDAVPTHLLTAEAYETYLPRLATAEVDGADGALVVHVSNRYLDLTRVVRAAAEKYSLICVEIHSPKVPEQQISSADWMILTRNEELLAALAPFAYKPASAPKPPVLWTDARSSLWEIIK